MSESELVNCPRCADIREDIISRGKSVYPSDCALCRYWGGGVTLAGLAVEYRLTGFPAMINGARHTALQDMIERWQSE